MWRDFINKIRRKRAKRQLNKALKVISKLSWEELDSIMPKPDYKLAFTKSDWSNVEFAYCNNVMNLFEEMKPTDYCSYGERREDNG